MCDKVIYYHAGNYKSNHNSVTKFIPTGREEEVGWPRETNLARAVASLAWPDLRGGRGGSHYRQVCVNKWHAK